MDEGPAHVLTLGRTRPRRHIGLAAVQIEPQWTINYMTPPTSPAQPQNLLRATLQNGPHALGNAAMNVVEDGSLGNFGKVMRALGQDNGAQANGNANGNVMVPLGPPANGAVNGNANGKKMVPAPGWYWALSAGSSAASAYHGYRRNQSVGWALWWALMGGMFPLVTPAIGLAQGWGKRAR
jgi:hypothetical protein